MISLIVLLYRYIFSIYNIINLKIELLYTISTIIYIISLNKYDHLIHYLIIDQLYVNSNYVFI